MKGKGVNVGFVVECPNHGGAFDCTPFCVVCEGNQEFVSEKVEVIFNLWNTKFYGHTEVDGFRLTAYQRGVEGTDTSTYKSVELLADELPAGVSEVYDDWFGEQDPLFVDLACLFIWKMIEKEKGND